MPRPAASIKSIRYHFTVPGADAQFAEWAKLQYNFSTSVRVAIKEYIARHGMTDAGCELISRIEANEVRSESVGETTGEVKEPDNDVKIVEQDTTTDMQTTQTDSHVGIMDDMLADLMK